MSHRALYRALPLQLPLPVSTNPHGTYQTCHMHLPAHRPPDKPIQFHAVSTPSDSENTFPQAATTFAPPPT